MYVTRVRELAAALPAHKITVLHSRSAHGFSSGTSAFLPLSKFANSPYQRSVSNSICTKVAPIVERLDTCSFPFSERGFSSLKLSRLLLLRLQDVDLQVPTDVQVAAVPLVLAGHDAAVQSYTGSGKTLAFLLPILSRIGPLSEEIQGHTGAAISRGRGVEAVIVAPSRELAMQIVREAERLLGPHNHKVVQQLIGGANMKNQEAALKKNKPLIVVGTPGRISEISRAGKLHTHGCRFLVLDEADQLLSLEYRESMHRILEHVGQRRSPESLLDSQGFLRTPSSGLLAVAEVVDQGTPASASKVRNRVERQTILVSATMPSAVLRAACKWGQRPRLVRSNTVFEVDESASAATEEGMGGSPVVDATLPPNLVHHYVIARLQHKVDAARRCIHALDAQCVLMFVNHGRVVKDVVFKLEARGMAARGLHGELSKAERSHVLSAFRMNKIRVLVCTEVAARGLDVPSCDLVINVELPTDGPHYAHRGGRTGRLGRRGSVISICERFEEFVLRKFEIELGVSISRCETKEGKLVLLS